MNECYLSEFATKNLFLLFLVLGYGLGIAANVYFNKLRQVKNGIVEVKRHGYARKYGSKK